MRLGFPALHCWVMAVINYQRSAVFVLLYFSRPQAFKIFNFLFFLLVCWPGGGGRGEGLVLGKEGGGVLNMP